MPFGNCLVPSAWKHKDDPRDEAQQNRAVVVKVLHLGMTRRTLHLLKILASQGVRGIDF